MTQEPQDKHGCLVIQEALESATREMQIPIMSELKGKVWLGRTWPWKALDLLVVAFVWASGRSGLLLKGCPSL